MTVRVVASLPTALARRFQPLFESAGCSFLNIPERDLARRLEQENVDLILVADGVLERRIGLDRLRGHSDRPEVIVVVPAEDAVRSAALQASGAWTVLSAERRGPALQESLRPWIDRLLEGERVRLQSASVPQPRLSDFTSHSGVMRQFLDLCRRVVDGDSSLLILGETGVGKEYLARAIHAESSRRGPFLAVNCAALPESLVESEFFGHEVGAFTGAVHAHRGYFELADRGTLFLDEIGELAPRVQAKLLRVLQEKAVVPVGSERSIHVDVRVVAATHRDPVQDIQTGSFRSDLFYRLAVVTLTVPPLRERREDIGTLIESYVLHYQLRLKRPPTRVHPEAHQLLLDYRWPGNVRELINVIERAVLLCHDGCITPSDLPEDIRAVPQTARPTSPLPPADPSLDYHAARERVLEQFDREYFEQLLQHTRGRIGRAAELAGISPRFLYGRMRELGMHKEKFRSSARPL